ncbi:MAG: cupin domain-containing protein [Rhodospirillaceae bacterium]|nr:cupin domain-containing protein [Rhodospirillaceae bacterium]
MDMKHAPQIAAAEVVLPCTELDPTVKFFTDRLGFRIDAIFPADDPAVAELSGHGLRLRLQRGDRRPPGVLRLLSRDPGVVDGASQMTAPNGTVVEFGPADPPVAMPPINQTFVLQKISGNAKWGVGRAGMLYRDLIPDRQNGRFIASHIKIPDGGPVPDYVHFHKIRFQMIYCYRGWVRLVYEDQGPPFIMHAGDCVLQPPQIRHRVLECSPGLEVIEIGCPAEHMTCVDHELPLPTGALKPDRDFGGQRFVHHIAAKADWKPWRIDGFEARDIGIAAATDGLAGVKVARAAGKPTADSFSHSGEFLFQFVLEGGVTLKVEGKSGERLEPGDSFVIPAKMAYALLDGTPDLELLDVCLPAALPMTRLSAA